MRVCLWTACIWVALVTPLSLAAAQSPELEPSGVGQPVPVVVFDLVHTALSPSHYVIAIQSTGQASYRSDNPGGEASGENYTMQFTASEETRRKIFDLAKQAKRFEQRCEAKNKVAFTGTKTLTYLSDPPPDDITVPVNGIRTQCTYNFSSDPAVQQLTTMFQAIASTMQFGDRISQKLKYDKLSLHEELKRMEEAAQRGALSEIQGIAPVLRQVANDRGVVKTARDRARKLLLSAGAD